MTPFPSETALHDLLNQALSAPRAGIWIGDMSEQQATTLRTRLYILRNKLRGGPAGAAPLTPYDSLCFVAEKSPTGNEAALRIYASPLANFNVQPGTAPLPWHTPTTTTTTTTTTPTLPTSKTEIEPPPPEPKATTRHAPTIYTRPISTE